MKLIRSIIAICMALQVLVVTTGFSVNQHFCQGELLYSSLLGNVKACKMAGNTEGIAGNMKSTPGHPEEIPGDITDLPPCHNQGDTGKPGDAGKPGGSGKSGDSGKSGGSGKSGDSDEPGDKGTVPDAGKTADSFSKKPCCEDHQAAVAGKDMPTSLKKGENLLPPVKFLAAFTFTFFDSSFRSDKHFLFADHSPPLIQRDIPVLFQSFLI